VYCPKCGAPVKSSDVVYRRNAGWGVEKLLALFFGGVIALAGFGVLMGGVALSSTRGWLTDSNGYINTRSVTLQTETYAIVQQNININIEPTMMWRPTQGDIVTIRINAKSFSPSDEVFIGIASETDAYNYLKDVNYDRLVNMNWGWEGSTNALDDPTYSRHPGTKQPNTPTSMSFWVKSVEGVGSQTLEWAPKAGDYWIVVMNADGSTGVDVTTQLGAKIPFLATISNILIAAGVVTLLIGILIIYFGSLRNR
jgi:hypothetical protein